RSKAWRATATTSPSSRGGSGCRSSSPTSSCCRPPRRRTPTASSTSSTSCCRPRRGTDVAQSAIMARYPRLTKVGVGALLTVLVAVAYFVLFYDEISEAIAKQKRDEQTLRTELARVKQAEFEYHKDLAE